MVKFDRKTVIFFSLFFIVCFALSALTPIVGDDFIYSFNDSSTVRPLNLYDIFLNMEMQRDYVTARVVCHFFVQLFLMLPKWIFCIANAAVNTLSAYAMFSFFKSNKKTDILMLATAVAMVWCFMPVFGQIFLWLDGSCNYSWCIALMLAYILPFYRTFAEGNCRINIYQEVLLCIIALIFGAYSENAVIAAQIAACLFMIHIYCEQKKIHFKLIAPFVCTFVGYSFILTAPVITQGNKGTINIEFKTIVLVVLACLMIVAAVWCMFRFKRYLKFAPIPIAALWIVVVIHSAPEEQGLSGFISSTYICVTTLIAVFLSILCLGIYNEIDRKKIMAAFIMALGGSASVMVFIFATYFPARSLCYFVMLLIISSIIILDGICEKGKENQVKVFAGAIIACFALCFTIGIKDIMSVHYQYVERLNTMNEAHEKGYHTVFLNPYDYKTKYTAQYGIDDIGPDPAEYWINRYMADYYGFDTIYTK